MAKKKSAIFDEYVEDQKAKARDGSAILFEIEPEPEWRDVKDLVGERILLMTVAPDEPKFGERKSRVTALDEKDKPFSFSTEHSALIRNIDALEPYFPVWVVVESSKSRQGREYFHLQKQEGEGKEEEPEF